MDVAVKKVTCQFQLWKERGVQNPKIFVDVPYGSSLSKWACDGEGCGYQVRADFAAALEEKLLKELEEDR